MVETAAGLEQGSAWRRPELQKRGDAVKEWPSICGQCLIGFTLIHLSAVMRVNSSWLLDFSTRMDARAAQSTVGVACTHTAKQ
jgi:hypothetical protein